MVENIQNSFENYINLFIFYIQILIFGPTGSNCPFFYLSIFDNIATFCDLNHVLNSEYVAACLKLPVRHQPICIDPLHMGPYKPFNSPHMG